MSSLWFDEPDKEVAHEPFDPWKKREAKHQDDLNQQKLDRLASTSNNPRSRANSKSDNEDDWSNYSSICGPPKVTRNLSVIPMNHPHQLLYPDSDDDNDGKRSRRRSRSRSNSKSRQNSRPNSRQDQNDSKREDLSADDELSKLERKKSSYNIIHIISHPLGY